MRKTSTRPGLGRRRGRWIGSYLLRCLALGWVLTASGAFADDPPDAARLQARELFMRGAERVKDAQWGEALVAFEGSAQVFPHATTTFNIAACERALSRYTRARINFVLALEQARAHPEQLPEELAAEARGFVQQMDGLLARAQITLIPAEAEISLDGRPLALRPDMGGPTTLVAGILPPGKGTRPPQSSFEVLIDPGPHVITLSRKGYSDAVVNRNFASGSRANLRLELSLLPATLHVASVPRGAIVTVDGRDFGPAPVDVLRGAGTYRVVVEKTGFEPVDNRVTVLAGEESNFRATLVPERPSITRKWWFWASAVAVVGGGVALTYALTRSEPQPRPYNGGSTGWVVTPQAAQMRW